MKKIILFLALALGVEVNAQVVGGYLPVNSTKSATMGGLRVNGAITGTGVVTGGSLTTAGTLSVGSTATVSGLLNANGIRSNVNGSAGAINAISSDNTSYAAINFSTTSGAIAGQFFQAGSAFTNQGLLPNQSVFLNNLTSGGVHLMGGGSSGYVRFSTGGYATSNSRMTIFPSGQVAIGTTTVAPSATLDVTGTMSVSSTSTLQAVKMTSLTLSVPTSSSGLTAGQVWSNSGVLTVVP